MEKMTAEHKRLRFLRHSYEFARDEVAAIEKRKQEALEARLTLDPFEQLASLDSCGFLTELHHTAVREMRYRLELYVEHFDNLKAAEAA